MTPATESGAGGGLVDDGVCEGVAGGVDESVLGTWGHHHGALLAAAMAITTAIAVLIA